MREGVLMERELFSTHIATGQLVFLKDSLREFESNQFTPHGLHAIMKILEENFDMLFEQALNRIDGKPLGDHDITWWTLKRALRLLAIDARDPEQMREAREKYLLVFEQVATSPNPLSVLKLRVLLRTMFVVAQDIRARVGEQSRDPG